MYNQCIPPPKLWVRIPLRRGVLDTTLCDKVCPWLAADLWFSIGTHVSSTNKTDRHNITEIVTKVALSTITTSPFQELGAYQNVIFTEPQIHCHTNIISQFWSVCLWLSRKTNVKHNLIGYWTTKERIG
jgi:hypothetical protein